MDLQDSAEFRTLDIQLVSIATDDLEEMRRAATEDGVETPFLADAGADVSEAYGVLRWAVPSGEPGHTFVLVDSAGIVRWVKDYGAPENGGLMYVEVDELTRELASVAGAKRGS